MLPRSSGTPSIVVHVWAQIALDVMIPREFSCTRRDPIAFVRYGAIAEYEKKMIRTVQRGPGQLRLVC